MEAAEDGRRRWRCGGCSASNPGLSSAPSSDWPPPGTAASRPLLEVLCHSSASSCTETCPSSPGMWESHLLTAGTDCSPERICRLSVSLSDGGRARCERCESGCGWRRPGNRPCQLYAYRKATPSRPKKAASCLGQQQRSLRVAFSVDNGRLLHLLSLLHHESKKEQSR